MKSQSPILFWGETGVGKTQMARRIFERKQRKRQVEGDVVEINGAAVRGDAAMSTLFGYTMGASTGAVSNRAGLLKAADKGVLFLDEIGERAVEDKRFRAMGADKDSASDF